MSVSVTLPKMGESVVEGTIIRWLKSEGDTVALDEPIVEISTDKIDTEIPSPAAGVLKKIVAGPDQTVEVGAEIAVIDDAGSSGGDGGGNGEAPTAKSPETSGTEKAKAEEAQAKKAKAAEAEARPAEKAAAPKQQAEAKEMPAASQPETAARPAGPAPVGSPLVRKLAREQGVDLATIGGSGPGGRITKSDVLAAAAPSGGATVAMPSGPRAPIEPSSRFSIPEQPSEQVAFDHVRRAISEHMSRSRSTAADVTTVIEIDMTKVAMLRAQWGEAFKRAEGYSLTYMPFIAHAAVQALRAFPEFNAHILEDGKTAELFKQVHLGIAVGRDEGLIVPVIHGAEGLNITGLARAIRDLGERARSKGLRPEDVSGGTFTITNYGSFGGVVDTPIINQPQVAILGTGAILKRPAVVTIDGADAIAVRYLTFFSLSYDHRWVDGHKAAQFNGHIKRLLEEANFDVGA